MVTVIIATRNRPEKICGCLQSLLKQKKQKRVAIIIVDQSDNDNTLQLVENLRRKNNFITYLRQNLVGKSKALNTGICVAKSNILAFTDDDCIVSNNWTSRIESTFASHPDISCVTGNTYPYGNIPSWACQPTITTANASFVQPTHHQRVGFGNNFAVKRSALKSIGLFKTWLGPGSASTNCEDGEMILRILTFGYKILHDPKMLVYHNKKLNKAALKKQNLSYVCGEMACYGYYAFSGYGFATQVVTKNLVDSFKGIKRIVGDMLKRKILRTDDWILIIITFITRIKGLAIGLLYYLKELKFRMGERNSNQLIS